MVFVRVLRFSVPNINLVKILTMTAKLRHCDLFTAYRAGDGGVRAGTASAILGSDDSNTVDN